MSELKSVYIDRTGDWVRSGTNTGNFYLKSEVDKVIAHQKYRRCLAMAKWCECKRIDAADDRIPRKKWDFYGKWHKCWLIIAEKFKEA